MSFLLPFSNYFLALIGNPLAADLQKFDTGEIDGIR